MRRMINVKGVCSTLTVALIVGGSGWMYRMERLGTQLVEQGKLTSHRFGRNEQKIDELAEEIEENETSHQKNQQDIEDNEESILRVLDKVMSNEVRINVIEKSKPK